jgi:thiamine-phosphate diphosphorylase/hydroxyethylthiazole kinase
VLILQINYDVFKPIAQVESRGVDSVGIGFKDPEAFVKRLAKRESKKMMIFAKHMNMLSPIIGCVIVLTGPTDYISDGERVAILQNGPEVLGRITGSGCILGSIIASFCSVAAQKARENPTEAHSQLIPGDMFTAAITG